MTPAPAPAGPPPESKGQGSRTNIEMIFLQILDQQRTSQEQMAERTLIY